MSDLIIRPTESDVRRYLNHLTEVANHSTMANLKLRQAPGKETLSPREIQIVVLVCESYESKEISSLLNISTRTVEAHRINIMRKLKLDSVLLLQRWAIRQGLVQV